VLFLFWMASSVPHGDAVGRLAGAIRFVGREHGYPVGGKKAHRLALLFRRYGARWHVNPYLAMSVACQESGFLSHPSPAKLRRCGTVLEGGRAVSKCWYEEGRELGLMQVMPQFVPAAYRACVPRGGRLRRRRLLDPEVNVCMGVWLLARRRAKVLERLRKGRLFQVAGGTARWSSRYRPCSRRQRHFCRRGHMWECRRFWWVASYNWGGHKLVCGPLGRRADFEGYPMRILGRLHRALVRFGSVRARATYVEDLEYAFQFSGKRWWLGLTIRPPGTFSLAGWYPDADMPRLW